MVDKENKIIYCVGSCSNAAEYRCCEEDFCFECLCESFKADIIEMLKGKYDMDEIKDMF